MRADRRVRRVQCARCLDVVWTTHPWERVTCACGSVAVSGPPWRPRVDWWAAAPGGWSFVEGGDLEPDSGLDAGAVEAVENAARSPARLGYLNAPSEGRRGPVDRVDAPPGPPDTRTARELADVATAATGSAPPAWRHPDRPQVLRGDHLP